MTKFFAERLRLRGVVELRVWRNFGRKMEEKRE
jgi:hypothetical protein